MTAAERLQAAIATLEHQRAESSPGTWSSTPTGIDAVQTETYALRKSAVVVDDDIMPIDAQLIVTLHRTIDAQLAILRFGVKRQESVDWTNRLANREGDLQFKAAELELALADAILGSAS